MFLSGDIQLCGESACDDNARCVFDDVQQRPICECKPGFRGDGRTCAAISKYIWNSTQDFATYHIVKGESFKDYSWIQDFEADFP